MMHRIMNAGSCFLYISIFNFHLLHLQLIALADNTSYIPSENIVLNCGSNSSELAEYDGRNWTGDICSPYVPSNAAIKSLVAIAPTTLQSIPEVPYMTARIFRSQFTYRFNVTPGPKFIRLHFYPTSYLGLSVSKAFLSVTAGNFTLLHNFSVSLTTEYLNFAYLMKEFIVHVSGKNFELTLTPSSNDSDAYAFVNGIEVVSMPLNLYIRGDDAPLPFVGYYPKVVYIYNDSALETLYRVNVGGDQIQPKYDTGMFRTWDTDDGYLFGAEGLQPFDMNMPILYADNVPAYTAPEGVYRTSRSMPAFENGLINLNYNLTWFFPVDSGFSYLVRLHFCDVLKDITSVNQIVFSIFLNNETASADFDLIAMSGGLGAAAYQDFVVMIPKADEGKQDLWLDLHPNKESRPQYYSAILNGVEVFKLSSADKKTLAGLNPYRSKSESAVRVPRVAPFKKSKKFTYILIGCGLGAVALPILLCLVLYRLKVIRPRRMKSWCGLYVLTPNQVEKENKSSFCRHFSVREIKMATNNFDEVLLIGTGGFGSVYKGSFDRGATLVAIKRGNPMSEQGALEFETEIHLLSRLRHNNLVSLVGYCREDGEMMLAYDFMANGTLFDHLHLRRSDQPPLSWIQRLEICIGVARGLHYLHTGTEHRIIHRDIKTTNILLDHNWVAKISDFGLSKASHPTLSTTNVKGSIGYLDPEYYQYQKLTEKSDLYSLGVVLLEVLSSRPAVSPGEDDDEHANLAEWGVLCCRNGIAEQIVDPNLEGKIAAECFQIYLGVTMKCLAERGEERPSTGDVLQDLVLAMQLQKKADIACDGNVDGSDYHTNGLHSNSDLTPGVEFSDIIRPVGR